jgi:hypothetical protein
LGPVIHIQDTTPESAGMRLSAASPDGAGMSHLAPGQVTVEASVLLGFSLPRP